jgi:hypothetical protein
VIARERATIQDNIFGAGFGNRNVIVGIRSRCASYGRATGSQSGLAITKGIKSQRRALDNDSSILEI